MMDPTQYARWFRDSTPYISAHRHKTFVVMVGGDAIVHDNITHIVHDLALLSVLGVRVVLVHGARPQIDAAIAAAGLEPKFHGHHRITDQATIEHVEAAVARVRVRIEGLFSMGLPNTPLHNTKVHVLSGNLVTARPFGVIDGVDHLFTGRVRTIHAERIHQMLNERCIVLLSPLGYSPSGEAFNLTSEELAADVAIALGADKLIAFDSVSAVVDGDGAPISDLAPSDLDPLLDTAKFDDTTRLRLMELMRACRAGVPRTHLIGFRDDGALLQELFTAIGCGTQISEDEFQHIRRASVDDV
ncbi:MAG TPA: amino-acid N-acetyltransferase, partial [Pseudomonadales bacterium]|nr:amino-acid N-acetyltransferase [Pseudomonadales bacterium]